MEQNTDRASWSVVALVVVGIIMVFFRENLADFMTLIWTTLETQITGVNFTP